MLLELRIKDLAIIDDLSISFDPGFTVFTGETGAGKSIIIGAIDLILGDRASGEHIRSGRDEARVEALFDVSNLDGLAGTLEGAGVPASDTLLVKRIISRSGRNKIFINGSLSTLATLGEVGRRLIDVCGQSEHQSLTRPEEHIEMLDAFGSLEGLRAEMAAVFRRWAEARKELDALVAEMKKAAEDRELLEFQSKEIGDAALRAGEDEELKARRERLRNSERIFEAVSGAERVLYSDEGSVLDRLGSVLRQLKDAAGFDAGLEETVERLESAFFEIEDATGFLRDYAGSMEGEPGMLEEVESRLDTISRLMRKYGNTIEEILATKDSIDRRLRKIEDYEHGLSELRERVDCTLEDALKIARSLSMRRREKAAELKAGIEDELRELGMKGTVFEVCVDTETNDDGTLRFGEKGADRVRFLISTNAGEELKPLSRIASGGELSRIMLAMKGLISAGRVPTLVFDEVDTGIGSAMAQVVGRKLREAAATGQVLCITHLPQIAAFADAHYHVAKGQSKEGRTVTRVTRLSDSERLVHIARMLGGGEPTEVTLKHARELLEGTGRLTV